MHAMYVTEFEGMGQNQMEREAKYLREALDAEFGDEPGVREINVRPRIDWCGR
jgi:hypothetical protein